MMPFDKLWCYLIKYDATTFRAVARIFRRGVTDLFVCVHKHAKVGGLGACSPRKFLKLEIVSEVILGQKQSRSSYMARGYFHPIFGFPCVHLLRQLKSNFHEKVLSLAKQQVE